MHKRQERPRPPARREPSVHEEEEVTLDTEVKRCPSELIAALSAPLATPMVQTIAAPIVQPIANAESTEPDGEGEIAPTDPVTPAYVPPPQPRARSLSSPWSKVPSNAMFSALLIEAVADAKPIFSARHGARPKIESSGGTLDFDIDLECAEDSLVDTEVIEFWK